MLDDGLAKVGGGAMAPGACGGAQIMGQGEGGTGMSPGFTPGPREEGLAGGRDANALGSDPGQPL